MSALFRSLGIAAPLFLSASVLLLTKKMNEKMKEIKKNQRVAAAAAAAAVVLSGVCGARAAAFAVPSFPLLPSTSSPELELLTEKTRPRLSFLVVVVAAAAALLSSSASSPFRETAFVVVVVVAVSTAVAFGPVFSEPPKCFTAPEHIFENQKKFREFIATLTTRQRQSASAGTFLSLSPPALPASGSGSLISARQERQNSSANRSPKAIRATKKVETMASPQRVYALLLLLSPFSPAAAERAQRR